MDGLDAACVEENSLRKCGPQGIPYNLWHESRLPSEITALTREKVWAGGLPLSMCAWNSSLKLSNQLDCFFESTPKQELKFIW